MEILLSIVFRFALNNFCRVLHNYPSTLTSFTYTFVINLSGLGREKLESFHWVLKVLTSMSRKELSHETKRAFHHQQHNRSSRLEHEGSEFL